MYSIEQISKMTELPRRTIRYYVQIGLIPAPEGGGRGSYYTDEHLKILEKIKQWTAQGAALFQIKHLLAGNEVPSVNETAEKPKPAEPSLHVQPAEYIRINEKTILLTSPGTYSVTELQRIFHFINSLSPEGDTHDC